MSSLGGPKIQSFMEGVKHIRLFSNIQTCIDSFECCITDKFWGYIVNAVWANDLCHLFCYIGIFISSNLHICHLCRCFWPNILSQHKVLRISGLDGLENTIWYNIYKKIMIIYLLFHIIWNLILRKLKSFDFSLIAMLSTALSKSGLVLEI